MADIVEVWGSSFPTRKPLNIAGATEPKRDAQKEDRVAASPAERTQATVFKNRKTIDDLSKSLPIVQTDEEGERNFQPTKSRAIRSPDNFREEMTNEYPYAPPGFQAQAQELKLNKILSMIEQNKTGYETSTTHDALLYVFTGIFFLFTLDTFVRLGKRMR
jgi:hypothetical protein